ncbi:MAG: asparaginase [Cytophagales bacterium]|nr:asparaginase [Cytophagales bacterium]
MKDYREIQIPSERESTSSVLVIYTGGTIGMKLGTDEKSLVPFDFEEILNHVPELSLLPINITVFELSTLLDSSNISPEDWLNLVEIIEKQYEKYDGFLILHGTDTMAYSASALSFLLAGLSKSIIFTGAQLPIGALRNDAKENLLTSFELLTSPKSPHEVCIYFRGVLLRGNRATKVQTNYFDAFASDNYPSLAKVGVNIDYSPKYYFSKPNGKLKVYKELEKSVMVLKLFPAITEPIFRNILFRSNIKGLVLESFGAGNIMTKKWFLDCLQEAVEQEILIYNISQCQGGKVLQGYYETSQFLDEIGVINGGDCTTEAALTKLMFVLKNVPKGQQKIFSSLNLRGELTIS